MPHIRVRGMSPAQVQTLSQDLVEGLAAIVNTSPDNFTIEHVPTQFYAHGHPEAGYPIMEVWWFERPADIKQKTAEHLTASVRRIMPQSDVVVIFHPLGKADYFENGRHF